MIPDIGKPPATIQSRELQSSFDLQSGLNIVENSILGEAIILAIFFTALLYVEAVSIPAGFHRLFCRAQGLVGLLIRAYISGLLTFPSSICCSRIAWLSML